MGFISIVKRILKHPKIFPLFRGVRQQVFLSLLDYPPHSKQRWDQGNPHKELLEIINSKRETYKHHFQSFLPFFDNLVKIHERQFGNLPSTSPCWINGWMPALDGVALYCFIALNRPKYYIEIGSGNSTKFARKAISDFQLDTKIISIDPFPRAEIDSICDRIVREPVENVNLEIFDLLNANDILYIDNSHRVFMNSDVTTIFLDVIPRLKPGVLVEIHDITLPYDYPADWIDRFYSEQYLLAAYLLAKGNRFEIVLPSMFVSCDAEIKDVLSPLWENETMKDVETHGCSFWIRMKE